MRTKLLLLLAVPFFAVARVDFKPGMQWECEKFGTTSPKELSHVETTTIYGDTVVDGVAAMKLRCVTDGTVSPTVLVRTDGEKVYAKLIETEYDDWYLLYDFGLRPGEGTYVYRINIYDRQFKPMKTYIDCVELGRNANYDGLETMIVEDSDGYDTFSGAWIAGIGSANGLLDNCGYGIVGTGSTLLSVSCGDDVLYTNNRTHFKNGTRWDSEVSDLVAPGNATFETATIGSDTIVDGDAVMKMDISCLSGAASYSLLVRPRGEKVHFRYDTPESTDWYLLYDFGLQPGEGAYVYLPNVTDTKSAPMKLYLECTGIKHDGRWEKMELEEYLPGLPDSPVGTGKWIKGLSSEMGVLENCGFGLAGTGSRLLKVSHGDYDIYTVGTTGLSVTTEDRLSVRVEDLHLYVSGVAGAVSLYTVDGKLLRSTVATEGEAHILLPKKGVYILKAGESAKKILAI